MPWIISCTSAAKSETRNFAELLQQKICKNIKWWLKCWTLQSLSLLFFEILGCLSGSFAVLSHLRDIGHVATSSINISFDFTWKRQIYKQFSLEFVEVQGTCCEQFFQHCSAKMPVVLITAAIFIVGHRVPRIAVGVALGQTHTVHHAQNTDSEDQEGCKTVWRHGKNHHKTNVQIVSKSFSFPRFFAKLSP